jgi:ABC-type branched-subunit amino acid transport system permease subunit
VSEDERFRQPDEPAGPRIGVDEWVARSAERTGQRQGPAGDVLRALDRVPRWALFATGGLLAALLPTVTSNDYVIRVGVVTLIFTLLALGLNVSVGLAGLLDLGYVAYYGIGAYGYSMLSSSQFGVHWPTWATVPLVLCIAFGVGVLLALPSRRLVGDYLAIVTLFFGEIFYTIATQGYHVPLITINGSHDFTGGPNGIANVDPFRVFGHQLTSNSAYYYVALGCVIVVFAVVHFANQSRTGRGWRALRDDPLAAEVMSMPVARLKVLALALGATIGALAGMINAASIQGAFPDDYGTPVLITIYAVVILGGAASLTGAVAGAIILNVLLEVLRTPDHARWIFYAAILIAILVKVRPLKRLAVVLGGTLLFGVVLHVIVAATWARGTKGLIPLGSDTFGHGGWLGWGLRHWLVLPAGTYAVGHVTVFNYLFVLLIVLVLGLTLLHGWWRILLMIPTIWLAGLVWETVLAEQGSGPTRFLLLGAILVVLMASRPQGLFGQPRVEIV